MASPTKFESLIQQGIELQKKGDLAGASRHFSKALSTNANHPQALWLAGMADLMQGRVAEGTRHLEKLARLQPASPDAHHALGKARQSQGRFDESLACYRKALGLSATHVPSLTALGALMIRNGDAVAAVEPLQRAVAIDPRNAEARFRLGIAQYQLGNVDEAISNLEVSISLMPGNPEPVSFLAYLLVEDRRWEKALPVVTRWAEMQPNLPQSWAVKGTVLLNTQKVEEALDCFEKGRAIDPNHAGSRSGLCNAHRLRGDFETAYGCIEPLLKLPRPEMPVIWAYAAVASSIGRAEEAARMVEEAITREDATAPDLRMLYFFAGELNDKVGNHDRAFEMYNQGNAISFGSDYMPEVFEARIDAAIRVFGKRGFPGLPRARHRIRRPILIVGMPRSGTSLLEQIIASHPRVAGAGECQDIMNMPGRMLRMSPSRTPYPDCVPDLTDDDMDQLVRDYDQTLARVDPKADRVTDKMPHNFLHLGLINLLMPEARVIHIQRDPVDTCVSNYFQDFASSFLAYARDLAHLGHHYRQYERLMAHWRTVLDMPFMEVRYEDLVADQERVSRQVIDFVGLEWDDACLSFHKTKRTVSTASYAQVRNPIYTKSVERWRRYEKHLGPLLDALGIKA